MTACVKCPLLSEGIWRSQLIHQDERISLLLVWSSFLMTNCSPCLLLTCAELGTTGSVWSWDSKSSAGLCPHRGCENPLSHWAKCSGNTWGTRCAQYRSPDPCPCPWQEPLHQRHDQLTFLVQSGCHPNGECLEKWLDHTVARSQELVGRWQVTYG